MRSSDFRKSSLHLFDSEPRLRINPVTDIAGFQVYYLEFRTRVSEQLSSFQLYFL